MSLMCSQCDTDRLIAMAREAGVDRAGVAIAAEVPESVTEGYRQWLARGGNASMDYLAKYNSVRRDPRELLPGAKSVISCAIGYYHEARQPAGAPAIATYAHGDDYHDVVRAILDPLAQQIKEEWGGETRVCVDTAPIHERYWAVASGVAFRGKSGLVIVPGLGTYCFLAEIITTVQFEPTPPCEVKWCDGCGRCVRSCPGGAIGTDGTVDAARCLSYLTIEHRGEFETDLRTGNRLYGCDTCQQVCPHNAGLQDCSHREFDLRPAYTTLTPEGIASMSQDEYAAMFRRSAIKRAKLAGLQRNARHL